MPYELELTKANRLRLAEAFRHNKRVDLSIPCVIEGQMGRALVDSLTRPTAFEITTGPFCYFAGDARGPGGRALIQAVPPYHLLMPSPPDWTEVAQTLRSLQAFTRFSFSADALSLAHLERLAGAGHRRARFAAVDAAILVQLEERPEPYFEIPDFDSSQDFLERGIGYAALVGESVVGAAYSSLICNQGIEVSIYVEERYRQQGIATAVGSRLLLKSLRRGLRPNWDAANTESGKLARKLGYVFSEAYQAFAIVDSAG